MFIKTLNNTILNIWPQLTIIIVIIVSVRLVAIKNSTRRFNFHEEFFNLLFIIYMLLLFELLTGTENKFGSGYNIVPFVEIFRYEVGSKMFIYNVLGNILAFIPFGYFVSKYIKPKSIIQIFYLSIITSVTIELMPLQIGRSFDIDDILLNVIGGIIGYFIYASFKNIKKHLPSFFQKDFIYNIISFIILIFIILYLFNLVGIRWIF